MPKLFLILVLVALTAILAYFIIQGAVNKEQQNFTMGNLVLKSSAFKEGEMIPPKFTCDGENVSPLLELKNISPETKSLVLIVDDPDATGGVTWDHWLLWNIDPKSQYISEDSMPFSAKQGMTSFGKTKYGGPCPPRSSSAHRYMFKLYALDTILDLPDGASKADIEKAMAGHILEQTVLMGRYARK